MELARNGPLLPWPLIVLIVIAFLVVIAVASRPGVRQRNPWLLPESAAIGALAGIHLLFFWQPYRTSALVPAGGGDLASLYYPMHAFAASEMQEGRFPFWNPHLFSGMPHLGNVQSAALYPPNLVAYVLADPFQYATLELLAIGHFFIASAGAYLLGRAYGLNRPASVLAGSIFAYSGFMVAHLGHYPMISVAAWAPFIFAALVMSIRCRSWGYVAAGVLPVTLALLGGHPPILLLALTLGLAIALFEVWRSVEFASPKDWKIGSLAHALARPAVMIALPFGIAMPFLGPVWELSRQALRSNLDYADASAFSVEPMALLHLVTPTVFGSNPTNYWGAFTSTEIWGYTGVVSLLLAAYAVAVRGSRTRLFWAAVIFAGLLYLLGPYTPIHGWSYAFVPGFDRIRAAGRAYFWFDLAVALLAGWGLQQLVISRGKWSGWQERVTRFGLLGLLAAVAALVLFTIPLFMAEVLGTDAPTNRPVITLDNLMLLAVWLALALVAGVVIYRSVLTGGMAAAVLISLALIDLFSATASFNPTSENVLAGYEHPETVAFLQEQYEASGPFRFDVITSAWQPNLAQLEGLDSIGGVYDPMQVERYQKFLENAQADRGLTPYAALNSRYLIGDTELDPPDPELFNKVHTASDSIVVWEHVDALPRAWVAGTGEPLTVDIDQPGRLELELASATEGQTIVVSQLDYPGWTATVDGEQVAINQYENVLQSLEVPPGATTVELTYRPTHWALYLLVSATCMLIWLSMVLVLAVRRVKR